MAVIQSQAQGDDSIRSTGRVVVDVVRGSASGESRGRELAIRAGQAKLSLKKGSRAKVRVRANESTRIDVLGGQAVVKIEGQSPQKISAGQRGQIDQQGRISTRELAVALLAPDDGKRIYFSDIPPEMEFRWQTKEASDPCLFEISQDAGFEKLVASRRPDKPLVKIPELSAGSFYWRVRCGDLKTGQVSPECKLSLIIDAPPVLYRPSPGELVYLPGKKSLLFAWSRVPDVDHYQIEITRDARELVNKQVTKPQYLHLGGLKEGHYCFRARSVDPGRGDPLWSRSACFRVINRPVPRAPRLFDPKVEKVPPGSEAQESPRGSWLWWLVGGVAHAAEKPTRAIVLRWEAIPGISTYILEIAEDQEFKKMVVQKRVNHNYFRWHTLTHRTYFWRVKSVDAAGRAGEFGQSKIIGAVVRGPAPLAPKPGTEITLNKKTASVKLRWRRSELLASYLVQISREASFSRKESHSVRNKNTLTYQASATGGYYWRVIGIDLNGRKSRPGQTGKFVVRLGRPRAIHPANQALIAWETENQQVKLSWSPRPAGRYQIQLARNPRFRKALTRTAAKPSLVHRPKEMGTLYWRVRCQEPESEWSRTSLFRLVPMAPALVSPEQGALVQMTTDSLAIELSWQKVVKAAAYLVDIEQREPLRVDGTSTTIDFPPGRYRWKVRALDASGAESQPSSPRSFELRPADLPEAVKLSSPANDEEIPHPASRPVAPRPPKIVAGKPTPAELPVVHLAPHLSFFYNLGEVSTLRYGLELNYRLPVWERRLAVSLMASYYTASASTSVAEGDLSADSRVHTFPLDFTLTMRFPTSLVDPYLGAGLNVCISHALVSMATQPELRQTDVDFGLVAVAGLEIPLGPGAAFVEFRYGLSTQSVELVEINPGGLTFGAGYRIGIW